MSAEVLRQAARLMRERAEAASAGPWKRFGMAGVAGAEWEIVDERRVECDGCNEPVALLGCATNADALHIASWHPVPALAVADWLDEVGQFYEYMAPTNYYTENPDDLIGHPMVKPALAVARAYLGSDQ